MQFDRRSKDYLEIKLLFVFFYKLLHKAVICLYKLLQKAVICLYKLLQKAVICLYKLLRKHDPECM